MVVVCECKTIWKGPYLAKSLFFGEPYLLIPLRIRGNRLAATYFFALLFAHVKNYSYLCTAILKKTQTYETQTLIPSGRHRTGRM